MLAFGVAGKGKLALKQQLAANLNESVGALRRDTVMAIDAALGEFRPPLSRAAEGLLEAQLHELSRLIVAADTAAKLDEDMRQKTINNLRRRRTAVAEQREALETILRRVIENCPGTSGPPPMSNDQ